FSRHQEAPGRRSLADLLRGPRGAGPEEEALDLGAVGLAETAAQRGHDAGNAQGTRSAQADPAAARRAVEERAGRAPVRAAGVSLPPRGVRGFGFQTAERSSLRA